MKSYLTPDLRAITQGLSPADLAALAYQAAERQRFEAELAREHEERCRVLRQNYRETRRGMDTRNPFSGN